MERQRGTQYPGAHDPGPSRGPGERGGMVNPDPVCKALAGAFKTCFSGAMVTFGPPPDRERATSKRFTIEASDKTVLLDVSDDRLAEISNSRDIEKGHPYKDDNELNKVLVDEIKREGLLEMLRHVPEGKKVVWHAGAAPWFEDLS